MTEACARPVFWSKSKLQSPTILFWNLCNLRLLSCVIFNGALETLLSNLLPWSRGALMIVCSCNVLSDTKIKDLVNSGTCPRTPGAVYKCLGCSPNCGRCIATLRTIINEALGGDFLRPGIVPGTLRAGNGRTLLPLKEGRRRFKSVPPALRRGVNAAWCSGT